MMPNDSVAASRSSSRQWIWWVLAVVVILVTAVGVVFSVTSVIAVQNMPKTIVARYLGALEHGKAEEAMRVAGIKANSGDVLLTDAAYAKAKDRITSFTLGGVVSHGGTATVAATIVQGGRKHVQSFEVDKSGGLPGLPFWRLAGVATDSVDIQLAGPAGLTVTVAGVSPTSAPIGTEVTLRAFPGTYPVDVTSPSAEYRVQGADVVSTPAGGALKPTRFVAQLSPKGETDAQAAVEAWLDACVASAVADPPGCPFVVDTDEGISLSDLHWTLGTRPTVTVATGWTDTGWLVVSGDGTVTATATLTRQSDGSSGSGESDVITFSYSGDVTFDGDKAVFSPLIGDPGTAG